MKNHKTIVKDHEDQVLQMKKLHSKELEVCNSFFAFHTMETTNGTCHIFACVRNNGELLKITGKRQKNVFTRITN